MTYTSNGLDDNGDNSVLNVERENGKTKINRFFMGNFNVTTFSLAKVDTNTFFKIMTLKEEKTMKGGYHSNSNST